jgi:hypothetical protein
MIKTSENTKVGPGPNYFSGRGVRVEADGLHLRAEVQDGRLYCAELVSVESCGFGTYEFKIGTDTTRLDSNLVLVLGLFTWSDAPAYNHREIDIELSRWEAARQRERTICCSAIYDSREHNSVLASERLAVIDG